MSSNLKRAIVYLIGAIATALGIFFGLSSCKATRILTTTASCVQVGDSSTTIMTKTVEGYQAVKK